MPVWAQYGGTQTVDDTMRVPTKFHVFRVGNGQRIVASRIGADSLVVTGSGLVSSKFAVGTTDTTGTAGLKVYRNSADSNPVAYIHQDNASAIGATLQIDNDASESEVPSLQIMSADGYSKFNLLSKYKDTTAAGDTIDIPSNIGFAPSDDLAAFGQATVMYREGSITNDNGVAFLIYGAHKNGGNPVFRSSEIIADTDAQLTLFYNDTTARFAIKSASTNIRMVKIIAWEAASGGP